MKKNKKALTPIEVDNLKNKKKSLNLLLEQMRVTGIRRNENEYLSELKNINLILESENITESSELIPFGGFEMDNSDLKSKSTEELLRIQTIQLNLILQKQIDFYSENQNLNKKLTNATLKIYANIQFWFYLFVITVVFYILFLVIKNS